LAPLDYYSRGGLVYLIGQLTCYLDRSYHVLVTQNFAMPDDLCCIQRN
jgi:hypothetical protein